MWLGLVLTVVALGTIYSSDRPLRRGQRRVFWDPEGEPLVGTYYPGVERAGVMLLEGFGSDQVTMRSAVGEFVKAGYHVLTFDFSGHGRSPGALGFDNAATDRLARQVIAAREELQSRSGLPAEHIVLMGHSMGARVALQAATMDDAQVAGLVLLGTQVNLAANVQSQVFTGVRDADLAWVRSLGPESPPTDVLLISGTWDDILTVEAAHSLLAKLTGDDQARAGVSGSDLGSGTGRSMELIPRLVHNYEMVSPRALALAKTGAARMLGDEVTGLSPVGAWRPVLWMAALGGIFLTLVSGIRRTALAPWAVSGSQAPIQVIDRRRFLRAKLWLWFGALPLVAVLSGLFFLIPLGLPAFNFIYVGFIGAYGVLLALLYATGRMPGTEGRLAPWRGTRSAQPWWRWAAALGIGMATSLLLVLFARSGWFLAPPTGDRLVWLVAFTPVTALGFWVGREEAGIAIEGRWHLVNTLIGMAPFFLWTAFQMALGSTSGVLGSLHGLLILTAVTLQGAWMAQLVRAPWPIALWQAVTLYMLILPQGVLFAR
jgi:pimeloyl-ACP methyl ester carboxylesterase